MRERITRIARIAPYLLVAGAVLLAAFLGAVHTASPSVAYAQQPAPTPTPLPDAERAREDAAKAQANYDQALKDKAARQQQLNVLQSDLGSIQNTIDQAGKTVAETLARADALDLQQARSYSQQAGLLAAQASYSVTLALAEIEQLRAEGPAVITLTQNVADLQNLVAKLQGTVASLQNDNTQLRTTIVLQRKPPPVVGEYVSPELVAAVIVLTIFAGMFVTYQVLKLLLVRRQQPRIVFSLPQQSRTSNTTDEVIEG